MLVGNGKHRVLVAVAVNPHRANNNLGCAIEVGRNVVEKADLFAGRHGFLEKAPDRRCCRGRLVRQRGMIQRVGGGGSLPREVGGGGILLLRSCAAVVPWLLRQWNWRVSSGTAPLSASLSYRSLVKKSCTSP